MDTYGVVIEEVIVDMLQESGATEMDGDDIMVNLRELGGHIVRYQVPEQKAEFVALFMKDTIEKVMYVWEEDGEVRNVPMNKEELERVTQNGVKES